MISVIIPTRNRAELLRCCLSSLCEQSSNAEAKFEVIVVDNGSTDNTKSVAGEFFDRLELRYEYAAKPGLHVGRHQGLKAAIGDVLAFVDDDIEALPGWIAAIDSTFKSASVAMAGGNNLPNLEGVMPAWLSILWQHQSLRGERSVPQLSICKYQGRSKEFSPYAVWGCNFLVRRTVIEDAGGFHPDGMPNELEMYRGDGETHISRFVANNGLRCVFNPLASVLHKVSAKRMSMEYFGTRAYNQGISDSYTALRMKYSTECLRGPPMRVRFNRLLRSLTMRLRMSGLMHPDLRGLRDQMTAKYNEGYLRHQQAFHADEDIRQWVTRADYFSE